MNKIILGLLLISGLLSASVSMSLTDADIQDKKIKTMEDFIELEKTLNGAKIIDPMKSNYYLGLLYLTEHKLENGKSIYPNYDKALPFLEKSLEEGNILAAYSVAMLFLKQNQVDKAIFVLHMTLESFEPKDEKTSSSGAYLSAALASIILDFKINDKEALGLGIMHLKKYVDLKDMPSGLYLLSQLYLYAGDLNNANMMLTRSCKHTKAPEEIKSICKTFKGTPIHIISATPHAA